MRALGLLSVALLLAGARDGAAADPQIPRLCIARIQEGIVLDGRLSEPAWQKASRVEQWFETSPGDNVPPRVESLGYLAYDERYLYVGFDFRDPEPQRIRSPLGDRDSLTSAMDHGGVLLDTRNDGRTGMIFAANARGSQYDSIMDDAVGTDDTAPDFYWDAATHIDDGGWTLEMRIPFSSLRYGDRNPEAWRIILYRIYPREFWYQMQSTAVPRGVGCWVCRASPLLGLHDLPASGSLVAAPYLSGRRASQPVDGPGSPLAPGSARGELGGDAKWSPAGGQVIDLTLNPDFSQVEADVGQIGANERFALFYPEKRPFFLEGLDLFSTPVRAIHTRSVTSPQWGARATGRFGAMSYTALVARDEGGGSVILPGPTGSGTADQDFRSYALIGRARRDLGRSFVSLLVSAREIDGGGHNRVFGPDFQWRPSLRDTVTGQVLLSRSETPRRPELAEEWDGRSLSGHALDLRWGHSTRRLDWTTELIDVGDGFRADNGYVPQVGYNRVYAEAGWTFWPQGLFRKLRLFGYAGRANDTAGERITQRRSFGLDWSGRWYSRGQLDLVFDKIRTGEVLIPQAHLLYELALSPSRVLSELRLSGSLGEAIDFEDHRGGTGADVTLRASLRPSNHLELQLNASRRTVNLEAGMGEARILTAQVERLRATYTLTPRSFVRLVGQYLETRRDPAFYTKGVEPRSGAASLSALFAYKLNWQTVLFLGYGDERALSDHDRLVPARRELFVKLSYALQR